MKNSDKPINPIFNNHGGITHESHIKDSSLIGLTKKECFSVLAMQGMLANPNGVMNKNGDWMRSPEQFAEMSILCADELLKQLEKK